MKNYIFLPPADLSYEKKAYEIHVGGKLHSKVISNSRAFKKAKWLKYSFFNKTVEFKTIRGELIWSL